jgi:hypothetical protein
MVLFQPDGVAGVWQHWRGRAASRSASAANNTHTKAA